MLLRTLLLVYVVCTLLVALAAAATYILGRAILDSIVGAIVLLLV